MKHALMFIALAVGLIASTTFAQTVANGPYYATPSWDQTLAPNVRFIVLANMNQEAVLDRETGLVWDRDPTAHPGGNMSAWVSAVALCPQFRVGNRVGWRLPTLHELQSLVDPSKLFDPLKPFALGLPDGHPFLNVAPESYWVATSFSDFPTEAFVVSMAAGVGITTNLKSTNNRFWCVRGGGPITQY